MGFYTFPSLNPKIFPNPTVCEPERCFNTTITSRPDWSLWHMVVLIWSRGRPVAPDKLVTWWAQKQARQSDMSETEPLKRTCSSWLSSPKSLINEPNWWTKFICLIARQNHLVLLKKKKKNRQLIVMVLWVIICCLLCGQQWKPFSRHNIFILHTYLHWSERLWRTESFECVIYLFF